MAAETELKLRLSPADARRVARLGLLRGIPPATLQLENVYYDTPDHALAARRIALRHRRIGEQWLITVKSAEVAAGGLSTRAEWEYPCAPGELDFSGVDQKSLRKDLEKLRPRLAPLFSTNFRRRAWLLEPHAGLTIELALDDGEIVAAPPGADGAPGQQVKRPICELELELKAGEPLALFDLGLRLANKLTLLPENESKAQRGQRLYRGIADTPKAAGISQLAPTLSPLAAFRQLATDCLNHFLANVEGVRAADDPEYVHQARVALRRLRALLKVFSPRLPAAFVSTYNEAWRGFANQLGEARDHDVLVEETLPTINRHFDSHDAIEKFVAYAQRRRQHAHESARTAFNSPALGRLTLQFLNDLARLEDHADGPSLKAFANRRLKKRLARIRRAAADPAGRSIDELHRLRIQFKRLRYGVEFFAPLYRGKAIANYVAELKSIQDVLGRINDLDRALALESRAPGQVRCELVEGWLSASQQALIGTLPKIAGHFLALTAPWEQRKRRKGD